MMTVTPLILKVRSFQVQANSPAVFTHLELLLQNQMHFWEFDVTVEVKTELI